MWNKDLRAKIAAYKKALTEELRQRKRLVSKEMDYQYLEELVKRCENNRELIIEVRLNDGTQLTIKTDRNPTRPKSSALFEQIESEVMI